MVDRIYNAIRRDIYMVYCVLLACQVLIVSGVTAGRCILKHTPPWEENLALIRMVWFCLPNSAVTISKDLHLKVILISNFISDRIRTIMNLSDLLLVFIPGVVMVLGSYGLLGPTSRNIVDGMGLPSSILYAVVPVPGLIFTMATIDRGGTLLCYLGQ